MSKPWKEGHWLPGVLSKSQTIKLIKEDFIENIPVEAGEYKSIGFSSFDLHLSKKGYRMKKGAIKPCGDSYNKLITDPKYSEELKLEKDGCFSLKRGECYVFELKERFNSKIKETKIYGQATAKSSVGRLDVIVRLIVDGMSEYESFEPNSILSGKMYIEITPLTFNVKVKENISLSQLRLFYGSIEESIIDGKSISEALLLDGSSNDGSLSVDLSPTTVGGLKVSTFRAINDKTEYIELWKSPNKPNPCDFWKFEEAEKYGNSYRLTIQKDDFYILRSKEKIYLPPNVAVYCKAMDENLGEMRIHYAGFVHPFFGTDGEEENLVPKGTPLIFEVRGHNVNVNLEDKEKLARLIFYRMSEPAKLKDDDRSYNNQSLTLSGYFNSFPIKLCKDGGNGIVKEKIIKKARIEKNVKKNNGSLHKNKRNKNLPA